MRAINPATEEVLQDYPEHTTAQVEQKLQQALRAFDSWRRTTFSHRQSLMQRAAHLLRDQRTALSVLMTQEMGKPIASSEAEIDKCAAACEFFAAHAETFLSPELIETDASRSYVRYDPLGPVLAIMPWNFPFWQVFRFAAPAIMAGNVGILKHASNVPGTALAIERVFREAGFPDGIFTTLLVGNEAVGAIIRHPVIRAVTLTGSTKAGMSVASIAGSVVKKTVLELGGSDPFIVLADADVPAVAKAAAQARCINSGQSCIAAKRFIVEAPIADEFEQAFGAAMHELRAGDPMNRKNDIGPLARKDLVHDLHDQVQRAIAAGAKLVVGGRRIQGKGFFYPPTVLTNVQPGNPAFDEETFGPVAAVIRASSVENAVELANRSCFGLGASIWTRNVERAQKLAADLEAGCVFINAAVRSDPRLPFGGIKASGYGRELAEVGIREFVNLKTVWVK